MPQIVPPVPSIPICNLLSHQGGKGQIQEIIESSPEQDFIDLQPSQDITNDSTELVPIRRNERIHLQQKKKVSSGPVTRSQTRRDTGDNMSILAYEIDVGKTLEHSEINPSQGKKELDHEYFAISAEPTEENQIDATFSTQDLLILTNCRIRANSISNSRWK